MFLESLIPHNYCMFTSVCILNTAVNINHRAIDKPWPCNDALILQCN